MFSPLPIVSLGNSLSFLIAAFISWKLYVSYRANKGGELRSFFLTFVFIMFFFFFSAIPGLLSKNPLLLGLTNVISLPFALFGSYVFTLIPLNLLQLNLLKRVYIILFWLFFAVSLVYRVLGFGPLVETRQGNFVFWLRPDNPFMEFSFIMSGALLIVSVGLAGFVFFIYAFRKREDRFVFLRSLILGLGAMLLGAVAALNYIAGATPGIGAQAAASALAASSLLLLAFGIFRKNSGSS